MGVVLVGGARWIAGEAAYAGVGPRAFPVLIGVLLALAGLAFGARVLRGERFPEAGTPPDRRAVAWIVAGLALAVAIFEPLGFLPAATLAFASTARAFGSRRPLRDAALGAALGAAILAVFARGLGVSLPAGPLG